MPTDTNITWHLHQRMFAFWLCFGPQNNSRSYSFLLNKYCLLFLQKKWINATLVEYLRNVYKTSNIIENSILTSKPKSMFQWLRN